MSNAVLEAPANTHTLTYTELLVRGVELGAKCNPSESEATRLSYRSSWLGTLAAAGWTEGEWFGACYQGAV
jgi:hypothetical protein